MKAIVYREYGSPEVPKLEDADKPAAKKNEVFGDITFRGSGGFAEYTVAREALLALKPAGLTFEQAAAGGTCPAAVGPFLAGFSWRS